MDVDEARRLATAKLAELQDPAQPLRLADEPPDEYPWCWIFTFNTERWYQTGVLTDAAMTGPLVVDKDGSATWVAPSAPPLERWLNEHATRRGFPPVPVPAPTRLW